MAAEAWPKVYVYHRGQLKCVVVVNLDKYGEPTAKATITEVKA